MRRLIFAFLFLIANISFAQSVHLSFKGISIDGPIKSFVNKMEEKGYTKIESSDKGDLVIMSGKFAGKTCSIFVISSERTNTVSKVVACTSKYNSWSSIKFDYETFKDLYITKYGNPTDKFEAFLKPYYEGDGYEFQALEHDKCVYASFFEMDEGTIAIRMSRDAEITFIYEDKLNMDMLVKEKQNKLLDEI